MEREKTNQNIQLERTSTYHLISKDAVNAGLVEPNEPVETIKLVVT